MAGLEKVVPVPPEYTSEALRVAGGTTYYGDDAKAKRDLGYDPRSLDEGMRDTFSARKGGHPSTIEKASTA